MERKIYSITYEDAQKSHYERYDNSHIKTPQQKSYLFEYNPILDILDNHSISEEYLGILSYKFYTKSAIGRNLLTKSKLDILLDSHTGFDVYGLSKLSSKLFTGFEFIEKIHPGFFELFFPLCEDLCLSKEEPPFMINSNFFIAKTKIYKSYAEDVIKPAIELLDGKYRELAWRKCEYIGNPKIMDLTGLPFYTFHTFILERMMAQYCLTKGFRTINLLN